MKGELELKDQLGEYIAAVLNEVFPKSVMAYEKC